MLLPTVTTRQNEHSDIIQIHICKRPRGLDHDSAHRLYLVHAQSHGLDSITSMTPKLGDCMGGFPVRETRKDKQVDSFLWHTLFLEYSSVPTPAGRKRGLIGT